MTPAAEPGSRRRRARAALFWSIAVPCAVGLLTAAAFALFVIGAASLSPAGAHSFYAEDCCSGTDCFELPGGAVVFEPGRTVGGGANRRVVPDAWRIRAGTACRPEYEGGRIICLPETRIFDHDARIRVVPADAAEAGAQKFHACTNIVYTQGVARAELGCFYKPRGRF